MNVQKSQEVFDRLVEVMPGANTRSVTHYAPFPLAIERGQGCRLWDVDGNEYIDFVNNYTVLVHGNATPRIVEAINTAAENGTCFSSPTILQAELAERICARTPSIDFVRFCNSGSEAVLMAVRAARAFTGRHELIMPIGGYHGSWEQVSVKWDTVLPDADVTEGSAAETQPGIPPAVADLVHFVRFNDIEHLETLMERRGSAVAAVIMEPVLGQVIEVADPGFARAAKRLCSDYGSLFILDEVVTSRLHVGGWQAMHGIEPDLTVLGKTIGGGLPIGAFGGRREVMQIFDPRRTGVLPHHGTFNGNSLAMAAGCASLDMLSQSEIDRINRLGDRLAELLQAAASSVGSDVRVKNFGSLLHVDTTRMNELHRACLEEGIYVCPRGSMNVSTAMDEAVILEAVEAWKRALASLSWAQ